MKCERCHKERAGDDFTDVPRVGRFCLLCAANIEQIRAQYGDEPAKDWTFMPRNDLIALIEKPNATVLDCGCAAGYTMEALRAEGHAVYGLDIEDQRTVARDLPFIEADLENVRNGATALRYDDPLLHMPKLDYVLFGDVLEHLANPHAALRFAKMHLAPGGRILISVPNMGWIGAVLSIANQHFPREDTGHFDRTHLRFYTLDTLMETLARAGLKCVSWMSRQFPGTQPFAGAPGEKTLYRWENVAIECDEALYTMLNTYQILVVAEPA